MGEVKDIKTELFLKAFRETMEKMLGGEPNLFEKGVEKVVKEVFGDYTGEIEKLQKMADSLDPISRVKVNLLLISETLVGLVGIVAAFAESMNQAVNGCIATLDEMGLKRFEKGNSLKKEE